MSSELRGSVASQVTHGLLLMQSDAESHRSPGLARRASLRAARDGRFGESAKADAALLDMITFQVNGDTLPRLDGRLAQLLDDAMLVASLVAATRVRVLSGSKGHHIGSLGRDLRAVAQHERAAERLLEAIIGADREDLVVHLRRAFSLLYASERPVDTFALICQLEGWSFDRQGVQRRWAFDFWARTSDADDNLTKKDEDDR